MINILHIHTLPVISGSGINTFLSMKGIKNNSASMALACAPGGPLLDLVHDEGMEVITFPDMVQPIAPIKDIAATINLYRYLKKNRYHIVHTHNSKAGFIGRLSAKLAGVPVIIHTVHGFAFHDQEPLWRRMLFRNLERIASKWCDKMIFISGPLIDWALREKITSAGNIVKIYSGIDPDLFQPVSDEEKKQARIKWGINPGDPVAGIVSKLWDGKGHKVLIKAFKELLKDLDKAKLLIVGEGYLEDELRSCAEELGISDSVVFTGFKSNVSEVMACFDISVLPSFFEGMGRVLLEAMAMKIPVVASNVGGIPDLVKNNRNGILVTPGNVSELAKSMKKLLTNPKLLISMGEYGHQRVTETFSARSMSEKILNVYRDCLEEKGLKLGS
ncbi:glycosyltransferase family 4 protein [Thermodesulfobacteriota bacterium]